MDRIEKQAVRDFIGQHVDLAKTRLSDADALRLQEVIKNWSKYAGRAVSQTNTGDGWGSDGKYTRVVETTTTFLKDRVAIQIESTRTIDGVTEGPGRYVVTNARELLDLFKKRPWLLKD
jgi:hypothetical protein